jgi:hypothetical protein
MEMMKNQKKNSGTEGADQIKSSCDLNVDGGKKQLGKEGATKGSCEKDISAETEDSKGNVDGVDECGDGDNVYGENHEKSSANENNNNGGNSDEIDQRSDSNKGSDMEISSDEGQTDDESTKEKGANNDGHDEESGKDDGTEGADQIKSSCNLNVDGTKDQSGKEAATKGSCQKDISAETEESKGNVDGVVERSDGDNVIGENHEKSHANENNDGGKEQSGNIGRSKKDGRDKAEKDYESAKKKEQTMMEMMKNQEKKQRKWLWS